MITHDAGDFGIKSVIFAATDIESRVEFGPTLADKNRTGRNGFARKNFYAAPLTMTIAAIAGGTNTFFVSHNATPYLKLFFSKLRPGFHRA